MNYTEQLKNFRTYYQTKADGERSPFNPFKTLPSTYCRDLTRKISEVELIRAEEGMNLVQITPTFEAIDDDQLRAAVQIAYNCSRSDLLPVAAAKMPEYASLTPLLMYAHKKYHHVKYQEWDRNDPNIKWALGKFLFNTLQLPYDYTELKRYLDNNPVVYAKVRSEFLGGKPATGYANKPVDFYDGNDVGVAIKANNPANKMLFQTWIAHSSLRVPEAMILDPINWDNIPEALDLSVVELQSSGGMEW